MAPRKKSGAEETQTQKWIMTYRGGSERERVRHRGGGERGVILQQFRLAELKISLRERREEKGRRPHEFA